ncbi:transmembrane 4 L6 family member 4-like isoform X1 [Hyla sarda]|uniref:transmembrane 4 L6 family member 4-like isoform X1 n=1 Tax=Hyla sarda TaxID=327740 RepID=UPI0024C35EEF|nr:transmembrane 4 L6 family member 4-like isoform X1 [Hyla sarda]
MVTHLSSGLWRVLFGILCIVGALHRRHHVAAHAVPSSNRSGVRSDVMVVTESAVAGEAEALPECRGHLVDVATEMDGDIPGSGDGPEQWGQMIFPALVFLGMKNNDCCGCCGNESCGKRFAMFSSILFAAVGFVGAGYNFIISAVAINKGPICFTGNTNEIDGWEYAFSNGDYLKNHTLWKECKIYSFNEKEFNTEVIITWNLTLFSILLILGLVQAVLCAIQAINGLIGTICGDCKCCGCCDSNDGPV